MLRLSNVRGDKHKEETEYSWSNASDQKRKFVVGPSGGECGMKAAMEGLHKRVEIRCQVES
jgi:hypothetical protein